MINEKNESSWQQTMVEHCPIKECKGMLLQHPEHNYEKCSDCGKCFKIFWRYEEIKIRNRDGQ